MTPIEKNVIVVDEQGNSYEPTYPKRAKGLVNHGRARYLSENKICLACPPSKLEERKMEEKQLIDMETGEVLENGSSKMTLDYVLGQIEKIAADTAHLESAFEVLEKMDDGDSGDPGCPGNILGQAKAQAIADVVRSREATNQQLIAFYQKMYDDLKG